MPSPISPECQRFLRRQNFGALYVAITLLSLHWALVLYINSSYLAQFLSGAAIGIIYSLSAAFTILFLLFISHVLRRVGNYKLTLALAILELITLLGMAASDTLRVSIPLFMIHQTVVPLLLFNLDVYMERFIGKEEGTTGGRRGLYLTFMSFAGAIAPLVAGYLITQDDSSFSIAYVASALLLIPFFVIVIRYFNTFSDPEYVEVKILDTLREFWMTKALRSVFLAHLNLQIFFVATVIYIPLYLATVVGFSWQEIGLIIFSGLMAYVIFEYPIGIIADTYIGEKEMMIFGFIVIGITTISFAFLSEASVGIWMFVAFLSRVGASFVETTSESHFFKQTNGADINIISLFRITRPLSYLIGALLGSFALLYLPLQGIFVLVGLFMIFGLIAAASIHDTK